jgi:hypothetical protein
MSNKQTTNQRVRAAFRHARALGVNIESGRGRHAGVWFVGHDVALNIDELEQLVARAAEQKGDELSRPQVEAAA